MVAQFLEDSFGFAAFLGFGLSLGQFVCDRGFKPWIAGKAEDIVNAVRLAPSHEVFPAETGIRPKPDLDVGPTLPDLGDDKGDLLLGAGRGVDVRRPKLRQKQLPAAENVKRQIAVALVIAMEEPAFLIAVDRIVGGVEVEDDALRRGCLAFEKEADKQPLHGLLVQTEFAITVIFRPWRVFEPVQRRLASQRRAVGSLRFQLSRHKPQHRIVAQIIVIVKILVAKRNAMNALGEQRLDRVLDAVLPVRRSVSRKSNAPAFEVMAPPSKAAVTFRLPRLAKSRESWLHSVCIGDVLCSSRSLCCRRTFADSEPRCTYLS